MKHFSKLSLVEKSFIILLLVIFGGIVLHAPLSVGLGVLFPHYELLIKSWKEIMMGLAGLALLIILIKKRKFAVVKHPLLLLIAAYAALHIVLLPLYWQGTMATLAGILIDLRYLFFFALVFIAVQLYPWLRRPFLVTSLVGALIVVVFGFLQVFVLPVDILTYLGYGKDTITPYLTVDLNNDYIRINSTLRGPNSLGAYAGIVLTVLAAFWLRANHSRFKRPIPVVAVLIIGGIVSLWASYSRSALVAAVVGIFIVLALTVFRRLPKKVWITGTIVTFAVAGGLIAALGGTFVSNVLLHENPEGGSPVTSNDGHVDSLVDGTQRLLRQPLGAGIGSTGSASLEGPSPLIIENQYLFIGHEVGWLGLALFVAIVMSVLKRAWQRRSDWLALGVFASGVGLFLIALLLPILVDDTVSIVWWGLAAIALSRRES